MKFYRYEVQKTVGMNDNIARSTIILSTLNLYKETPKGYWIGYGSKMPNKLKSEARFVLKTGKKRYAYLTKEEAKIAFIARTKLRIRILEQQLEHCEIGLKLIEKEK